MKDILGQEIQIGDMVAYCTGGYVKLDHGIVTKFGNANNCRANNAWVKSNAICVITDQFKGTGIYEELYEKHKDSFEYEKPKSGQGLKYRVVVYKAANIAFVISFADDSELTQKLQDIRSYVQTQFAGSYFYPGTIYRVHDGRFGYSESCRITKAKRTLSMKSIKQLGLENYLDNPNGFEISILKNNPAISGTVWW